MTDRGHKVVGGCVDDAQQDISTANSKNEGGGKRCNVFGRCRIGNGTHHHGEHKLANGGECGTKEVKCHNAAIGLVIGQEFFDQARTFMLFLFHSDVSNSS